MLDEGKYKAVKESLDKSDYIAHYLENFKRWKYNINPNSAVAENYGSAWSEFMGHFRRHMVAYYPDYTEEEIMEALKEYTGYTCITTGRNNIWPETFCALVGKRMVDFHMLTCGRAFYFDPDSLSWQKRGAELGKIMSYNTDALDYGDFYSLPYEKAGQFEQGIRYYGIELEVNPKHNDKLNSVAKQVHGDLKTTFAILKADSSIGNGFEIVSSPATLNYHRGNGEYVGAWDKFFEGSAKLCRSWDTDRCGMHIHVSRSTFQSPNHLGKVSAFINAPVNKDFISRIAGRSDNYGRTNPDHNPLVSKILGRAVKQNMNGAPINSVFKPDKGYERCSVYLGKPNTIELRIFKGNVSKIGFFKNLEFFDSVIEYSKLYRYSPLSKIEEDMRKRRLKTGKATGQEMQVYGVDYRDYLKWLESDKSLNYPSLKLWLYKTGLLKNYTQKKVTPKTPKAKIVSDSDIVAVA